MGPGPSAATLCTCHGEGCPNSSRPWALGPLLPPCAPVAGRSGGGYGCCQIQVKAGLEEHQTLQGGETMCLLSMSSDVQVPGCL